jgi:hypothetical protein
MNLDLLSLTAVEFTLSFTLTLSPECLARTGRYPSFGRLLEDQEGSLEACTVAWIGPRCVDNPQEASLSLLFPNCTGVSLLRVQENNEWKDRPRLPCYLVFRSTL